MAKAPIWEQSPPTARILATIPNIWDHEIAPVEWAVEGLIPMGCVTLLSGAPDAGKTCFAITLSRDILHSENFIGRRVSRKKVIYCDLENPLSLFRQRLDDLSFRRSTDFHYWGQHCSTAPPQVDGSAEVREYIEMSKGVNGRVLFIFDTMVRFHDAQSENSASDMSQVMGCFREIAQTGAAVLLLHHRGKSESSQYRGSSDIQGAVDLSIMMVKDEENSLLTLKSTKNRIGSAAFKITLKYGFELGGLAVGEDEAQQVERRQVELIRSVIERRPGVCQSEITEELAGQVPEHRVRDILKRKDNPWHTGTGPRNRNRVDYFPGPEPEQKTET